jgi:hypothetical protein
MTESQVGARAESPALPDLLASPSQLSGRRTLFAVLVIATMAAVMWLCAVALGGRSWRPDVACSRSSLRCRGLSSGSERCDGFLILVSPLTRSRCHARRGTHSRRRADHGLGRLMVCIRTKTPRGHP